MTNEINVAALCDVLYHHVSRHSTLEVTTSGVVKIDGDRLTNQKMLSFLQKCAIENSQIQPLLLKSPGEVLNALRTTVISNQRIRARVDGIQVQSYDYTGLVPFQSITESDKYVLYDSINGVVTDLDFLTYRQSTNTNIEVVKARISFNPYSPRALDFRNDEYGRPCNFLNIYRKPLWQLSDDIGVEEGKKYKPSPLFFDFMAHLFPDIQCREFVYDWLHYALTDRCESYLVLNGSKGIGKNVFSEFLCKPLMGEKNHKIAQPSALTSDFNAILADSRMIVFDEFKIDNPDKVNKLKRYINEEQTIERKGVDVGKTVKTFNSFIISNNDQADMKIAWDDRRFSVADLTTIKLKDAWSKDKIDDLLAMFKDAEEMRSIGYWIMYRTPKFAKFDDWKGPHFYALCYSSFHEWQKVFIDMATSKDRMEITMADFKKEYRKRTDSSRHPSVVKVKDFLNNYRHEGRIPLGYLETSAFDQWVLKLHEEFQPDDVAVELDEDDSFGDLLA